jgi:hypothetical protein
MAGISVLWKMEDPDDKLLEYYNTILSAIGRAEEERACCLLLQASNFTIMVTNWPQRDQQLWRDMQSNELWRDQQGNKDAPGLGKTLKAFIRHS